MGITISKLHLVVDNSVLHFFPDEIIGLKLIGNQFRVLQINRTSDKLKDRSPSQIRASCATTLPPRWTAPMIASLSVPRPRLAGSSSDRLFFLRGFPPI